MNNTATQYGHSYSEKREAIEWMIEQHRQWREGTSGQQRMLSIMKSIAVDYRARERQKVVETAQRIERAIEYADKRKKPPVYSYEIGNLREIAELTIGSWPVIRQALEEFEK